MAVNKDPFVYSNSKDGKPKVFRGLVQAGSTAAIKIGEICAFNKTASYWTPITLAADYQYALAIAREEQKAADSARYIEFYSLHPDDVFEFQLAAARSLALGDRFILTASYSQKLTYSATAFPVCFCVDDGHYPETGTTIRSQSYARVSFNPACSAWGLMHSGTALHQPKLLAVTATTTLYAEQSGLTLLNTGASHAAVHTLPQSVPSGTWFRVYATVACQIGLDAGAAGAIYAQGAKGSDDGQASVTDEGDGFTLIADSNADWILIPHITSTSVESSALTIA